ncbi:cytochrome c3 family protein [Persephonella sp.]
MSAGPHKGLDCLGCHDPHYAKAQKIFKVKNDKYPNPRTGQKVKDINALCLGCHNLTEFGGAGVRPIYLHMTHPVGVQPNPKIAKVPEALLREGLLQCVSCHDPHPSNPNWKYLRVDTKNGTQVGVFCMTCHPAKADEKYYGITDIKIFTSMNEEAGKGFFSPTDPSLVMYNPTPNYIQPLGDYPNSLAPAYTTVPNQPWIYSPPPENLPEELKKLISPKQNQ